MKRRRDGSASLRIRVSWRRLAWVAAVATTTVSLENGADARSVMRVGNATMMNLTDISSAGCGFLSWPKMAETSYAAVLHASTGGGETNNRRTPPKASACGRCARVWCDDARLCTTTGTTEAIPTMEKKSAVVYIVEDQRPRGHTEPATSSTSDVNLSPQAFQNLTGTPSGRVPIRWQFMDCPSFHEDGKITASTPTPVDPVGCAVCVHGNSSAYWLALQPVNDTLGVSALHVNGQRANRPKDSPSYFFYVGDHNGRLNLTQLEISLTTRSRRRFSRLVAVKPGACVDVRQSDEQLHGAAAGDGGSTGNPSSWPDSTGEEDDDEQDEDDAEDDGNGNWNSDDASTPNNQGAFIFVQTDRPTSTSSPSMFLVPVAPVSPATASPPLPRPLTPPTTGSPLSPSFTFRPPTGPASSSAATISVAPSVTNAVVPEVSPPVPPPPPPLDKGGGGFPTPHPADAGIFGSGSGTRSRSPPLRPIEPSGSPPPSSSPPSPQPTIGRIPVVQLSGGVLTNPLFIGLLLGTVGLVGAVVAYRAKASQRHRLVLVPPASNAVHRTDFATL